MKVYADTVNHKVFTVDNLLVLVWRNKVTPIAMTTVSKAYRELPSTDNSCFLTVVHAHTTPPDGPERRAISDFMKTANFRGSALVHNGSGLRQALVISVAVAISRTFKLPYKHKVFSNMDLAFAWLAQYYVDINTVRPLVDKEAV